MRPVRAILATQVAVLLSFSMDSMSARVEYQHPDITIVAVEEHLESVLRAVGEEMQIRVTLPTGLNPVVNCDIHDQPLKQALKNLLVELSYSLEWQEGNERLVGLTILAGEDEVATASKGNTHTPDMDQENFRHASSISNHGAEIPAARRDLDTSVADHRPQRAEHEARKEAERAKRETRMTEEQQAHEAEMTLRRQKAEVERAARMEEYIARGEAESAILFAEEAARRP